MIFLIDNYDSFVYNLKRYFEELGETVCIARHDDISIEELKKKDPKGIVISPGPCSPNESGISNQVIETFSGQIPILGVCLGHQCIGHVFGGNVVRAPQPVHGKTSIIHHNEENFEHTFFNTIPKQFNVMRYHSLIIDHDTLPTCLEATAWIQDTPLIMAVRHKTHPTFGVQFHPESIKTDYGYDMLKNFLSFCDRLVAYQ